MTNRLYCTFVESQEVDNTINFLVKNCAILYNKIFILESKNKQYNKTLLTYNLDTINLQDNIYFEDTINVHRKKNTNTLYTINAINAVMKKEIGKIDPRYEINWEDYKNCLLLSKEDNLIIIPTVLKRVVEI